MKGYKRIVTMAISIAMLLSTTAMAEGEAISSITITTGSGQETQVYQYGEEKALEINVTNTGTVAANNVKITPQIEASTDGWPFEIGSSNYDQELGSIEAGQTVKVKYPLKARGDVASKYYKLGFTITYDDGVNQYSPQKYMFVKMEAKPEDKPNPPVIPAPEPAPEEAGGVPDFTNNDPVMMGSGSDSGGGAPASSAVPRVIVTGFNTEPGEVKAGSNFKLIIHLKNTSKATAVRNMLFNLSAPTEGKDENSAPAFLPVSGASSIYAETIPAGGTYDIALDLNAKADLVQKPYNIEVTMKYEDQAGTQFEAASSVSIPVKQDPRFEFSEFEINPNPVAIGEEANIMCNLYNLGRTKLYNVKAKFEGASITSKENFIGNVESGATAAIDAMVTAEKESVPGDKIKMILTYEDDAGKVTTLEKEIELTVTPVMADAGAAMMPMEAEKKGLPMIPILIGGGIAAVLVIAVVIIIRKKKKQREDVFANEFVGLIEDEQQ